MVKNFTRTITTTTVKASKINLETLGAIGHYELEVKEDLSKEEVIKLLIKRHGKTLLTEAYVVNEMVKTDITYSMSMEDFFKYAKVVPAKEPKKDEPKEPKKDEPKEVKQEDINPKTGSPDRTKEVEEALNKKYGKAGK